MVVTILFILAMIWLGLVIDNRTVLEAAGTMVYIICGVIGLYYAIITLIMNIEGHSNSEKFIPTLAAIFFLIVGAATMLMMRGVL